MANKTINDYSAAVSIDASSDYYLLEQGGVYKKINRNVGLGLSSAPLGTTDSQSPQNKTFDNTNSLTIKDGNLTIQNSSSTTKQAVFSAASITAGQTRTFTFPDASGTLVTAAGTQTLTNKTLTSPTITGGSIDNATITVDSIAGHTSGTVVTVANLQINNGVLNSAGAVTATSVAAGAIQPQALVSGTGSGWAWQSYTPVFTNTTKGTGTVSGKYIQVGKTVFGRASFVLANDGSSAVSTTVSVSLPVTVASGYSASNESIGYAALVDQSVSLYDGFLTYATTTTAFVQAKAASGSYVAAAGLAAGVPFTWGTNDGMYIYFCYEAA